MNDAISDKRSNLSKAFDPSILLEAFAIEQALTLLIDWNRMWFDNRADSDDYQPDELQFININFGGLIDERLRNTALWEKHSYKYTLTVGIHAGTETIDLADCLLTVVSVDFSPYGAAIEVSQYHLDLARFRALYNFLITDQANDVLKILKVCGFYEYDVDAKEYHA